MLDLTFFDLNDLNGLLGMCEDGANDDDTNIDDTNIDDTNIDDTNIDDTNIDDTNIDDTKYLVGFSLIILTYVNFIK